jgi:hypothetical protein
MQTPRLFYQRRASTPARRAGTVLVVPVVLLCACTAQSPLREDDNTEASQTSSQPILYGELGVSVDHVSVR